MDELVGILKRSLEDFRLSRRERREINDEVGRLGANSYHAEKARKAAFGFAREHLSNGDALVLDWLNAVFRATEPKPRRVPETKAYFSPSDACATRVRELIAFSKHRIDICVFTITDNRIVERIVEAHERGVRVRIISDDLKAQDTGSDIGRLARSGIDVRLDHTDSHMHHKFAIFDSEILLTGSYNWTRSAAAENNENIIVSDDRSLMAQFQNEFDQLWQRLAV